VGLRAGKTIADVLRELVATIPLWDAMSRASRSEVAVFALAVDAKDDQGRS
jgi:hypothetical protein